MERRKSVRFLLRAPVILRWTDASGKKREDVGRTHDISISGVFITGNAQLPVGTSFGLEVHLPPLDQAVLRRLSLTGTGKVIRQEAALESGFAASGLFTLSQGDTED
jgi:hypothetical protein